MIRHGQAPYLECSSRGDIRFSAYGARLRAYGNRSIEDVYQAAKIFTRLGTLPGLVVDRTGLRPHEAKQLQRDPSYILSNHAEVRLLYSHLWDLYLTEKPNLLPVLTAASGLSDIFGKPGNACQATELWRIRNAALGITDAT